MQHIQTTSIMTGGRRSSPELRASIEMAEAFEGLPAEVDRYDLLILVKRAGRQAGFTSGMIELLDYYMAFTREKDWEEGARPIVFQSLAKTALDFGVSERQIQKTEQALFRAGAITWNDSGNHRRYGQRDQRTGRLQFAYGVDLTPLAYLKATLEQKLAEKEARDAAWMTAKRQISAYRAKIRALIGEGEATNPGRAVEALAIYNSIAVPIKTYMDIDTLNAIRDEHKATMDQIQGWFMTESEVQMKEKKTPEGEQKFTPNNLTNQKQLDKSSTSNPEDNASEESVTRPSEVHVQPRNRGNSEKRAGEADQEQPTTGTGLEHVSWKQVLNAASDRFRAKIPVHNRPLDWVDLVDAAYGLCPELGISNSAWNDACTIMGRPGAALCVLLTDHAALREKDRVTNPGGYLRSMTRKAKSGELHLHRSIFGILKRAQDQCDA